MKRLLGFLFLALLIATSAGAENILTVDVGYMMMNFEAGALDLSQNSLTVNASMFLGDDSVKAFFNGSLGYMISSEYYNDTDSFSIDLSAFDSAFTGDFIGGIGGRFFISDSLLLLAGVGAHLYWGELTIFDVERDVVTAGIGGIVNLVILVDNDLGVNFGVKAAYDPLVLTASVVFGDVTRGVMVMPYVGMSMKM